METQIKFHLNGEDREVKCDSRQSLLEVLREELQLTGTKYGCGEGQCRACTVLIDGVAAPSCLIPIATVMAKQIETIEGLETKDGLNPVQKAFMEAEAIQCGYCVPGMVLSTVALLRRNPQPDTEAIVAALNGNLCRCCGYGNILKAVARAAQQNQGTTP